MTVAMYRIRRQIRQMVSGFPEKGQGTLEYLGMVIVAVTLAFGIILAAKDTQTGTKFTEQVTKILNGGAGSGQGGTGGQGGGDNG